MEQDIDGATWLVYPTKPGWHYKVESSTTTGAATFSTVPWYFSYGDGNEHRYFVSPPPPPGGGGAPPARTSRILENLQVRVANDTGMQKVEIKRTTGVIWGIVLDRALPVRTSPRPVLLMGHTATENWTISGTVSSTASSGFTNTSVLQASGGQQSLAQQDLDLLLAHWSELVGYLTPSEPNSTEPPDPPEDPLGDPQSGMHRFYRVIQTAIDTNGNGLYDWWELENPLDAEHPLNPFVTDVNDPGYGNPFGDPDKDGLNDDEEQGRGTDPRNYDTDGDLSPDGEEVDLLFDPLDPDSTPTVVVSVRRDMRSNMFYSYDNYHWAIFLDKQVADNTLGSTAWVQAYKDPNTQDPESLFHTSFPNFDAWGALLETHAEFPSTMPLWARRFRGVEPKLPMFDTFGYYPSEVSLAGVAVVELDEEESNRISQHRVWMRGPVAPAGGRSKTMLLRKETAKGNLIEGEFGWIVDFSTASYTVEAVALTVPEGERVSSNFVDLDPAFSQVESGPPSSLYFQCIQASLVAPEVVELAPLVVDELGNEQWGSELPSSTATLTPFVEVNPDANRIAHRELKVRIDPLLKNKTVTWSLGPIPGAIPATIRGDWNDSPVAVHKDRFETSAAFGAYGYHRVSQLTAETTIDANGYTAVRVNVPPVGFNKVRISIQIESIALPIDLIDMEVPAVVVIDPGHGGTANLPLSSWNNAVSPSGVLEKNMTLDYGTELRDALRAKAAKDDLNLRVFMTRDTDINVSGQNRAFVARDNGADIIFIIHFNSDDDASNGRIPHQSRGTLEVRRTTNNVNSADDITLIDDIIDRIVPAILPFDQAARKRDAVIYNTAVASDDNLGNTAAYHPIRAGYCEVEFIDNPTADLLLNTGPHANAVKVEIVNAMRDGIIDNLLNHQ